MEKKPRVRTRMDSQHVKVSQRPLKSSLHYFSHIFWSLWREISLKNSVLAASEFFRLFVKLLTPDDKCSLSVKASVQRNQFKCFYIKIKKYFLIFFCILGIYIKLGLLWKKRWASEFILFWIYRLQKAELLQCPKTHVSEYLWRVNRLKGPKHYLNLNGTIFVISFDHSEKKISSENSVSVIS